MKHYFYSHHKSEKTQNRETILLIFITDKNLNTVKKPSKNQHIPGVVWGTECLLSLFFGFGIQSLPQRIQVFHWIDENNLSPTSRLKHNKSFIMNLKKPSSIAQIALIDVGE